MSWFGSLLVAQKPGTRGWVRIGDAWWLVDLKILWCRAASWIFGKSFSVGVDIFLIWCVCVCLCLIETFNSVRTLPKSVSLSQNPTLTEIPREIFDQAFCVPSFSSVATPESLAWEYSEGQAPTKLPWRSLYVLSWCVYSTVKEALGRKWVSSTGHSGSKC